MAVSPLAGAPFAVLPSGGRCVGAVWLPFAPVRSGFGGRWDWPSSWAASCPWPRPSVSVEDPSEGAFVDTPPRSPSPGARPLVPGWWPPWAAASSDADDDVGACLPPLLPVSAPAGDLVPAGVSGLGRSSTATCVWRPWPEGDVCGSACGPSSECSPRPVPLPESVSLSPRPEPLALLEPRSFRPSRPPCDSSLRPGSSNSLDRFPRPSPRLPDAGSLFMRCRLLSSRSNSSSLRRFSNSLSHRFWLSRSPLRWACAYRSAQLRASWGVIPRRSPNLAMSIPTRSGDGPEFPAPLPAPFSFPPFRCWWNSFSSFSSSRRFSNSRSHRFCASTPPSCCASAYRSPHSRAS